jgi:hypothetical protein
MTGYIWEMVASSLRMLAGTILSSLGWGGIIAVVAAGLLVLSMSAKAMKFLSSARGMAATAAIMLGALAFMWWGWHTKTPPPIPPPYERTEHAALKPAATPELEAQAPAEEPGEEEAEEAPALAQPSKPHQELPEIPFIAPAATYVPPMAFPTVQKVGPQLPPSSPHSAPHRAPGVTTSRTITMPNNSPSVAAANPANKNGSGKPGGGTLAASHTSVSNAASHDPMTAARNNNLGGSTPPASQNGRASAARGTAHQNSMTAAQSGSGGGMGNTMAGGPGYTSGHNGMGNAANGPHRMTTAQRNHIANMQMEMMMGSYMNNLPHNQPGGMHPMNGMHPGGMHPGGGVHPGGMHHPGGHR